MISAALRKGSQVVAELPFSRQGKVSVPWWERSPSTEEDDLSGHKVEAVFSIEHAILPRHRLDEGEHVNRHRLHRYSTNAGT